MKRNFLVVVMLVVVKLAFCQQNVSLGEYFRCIKVDCRESETLELNDGHHFTIVNRSSRIKKIGSWIQLKDTIQFTLEKTNLVSKYVLREVYDVKLLVSVDHLNFSKTLSDMKFYIDEDETLTILKDSSYTHIDKENQKKMFIRNIVQKRIINFLFRQRNLPDIYVHYILLW